MIGWRATEAHFLDLLKTHLLPGVYLSVVARGPEGAERIRVRIHDALVSNPPSSTAERATGFTDFMLSRRAREILGLHP